MIPFQDELRPDLPTVYGSKDYQTFREQLVQINHLLVKSGLEMELVESALQALQKGRRPLSAKRRERVERYLFCAVRCNVARHLTGESFRLFAVRLADSGLLQWFCRLNQIDGVRPPSKSTLERFDKQFGVEWLDKALRGLVRQSLETIPAQKFGLGEALHLETVLVDTTCIKVNIHFPVDWVLLRDIVRTLMGSIKLIRREGLRHRMADPAEFTRQMNRLCIRMTHSRRHKGSKKYRKAVLRKMKKLTRLVQKHAHRYRTLLGENWEQTRWSRAQAEQILKRMDGVLDQLPEAIRQAHERIIGERQVDNADKILSLYEPDVHVIKRGKAGGEVEFGNGFYLAEQAEGLLIDWAYFQDQPPGDARLISGSVQRIKQAYGPMGALVADRGFESRKNRALLKQEGVYDAICPKQVDQLTDRARDPRFIELQRRRGQTEGRIGIFKNAFLGNPMRSKGWAHRHTTLLWCIFTHNLWVLARLALADEHRLKKAA